MKAPKVNKLFSLQFDYGGSGWKWGQSSLSTLVSMVEVGSELSIDTR